jgi:hypothetical protein
MFLIIFVKLYLIFKIHIKLTLYEFYLFRNIMIQAKLTSFIKRKFNEKENDTDTEAIDLQPKIQRVDNPGI